MTFVDIIVRDVCALGQSNTRHLIAIAGPPAAGKSTIAEKICTRINQAGHPCGLLPMDGFHRDNGDLEASGLLHRKGAPETFDLLAFSDRIQRLLQEDEVTVPAFDRKADCVRPAANVITKNQRHVVVEGNYLLFDAPGWRDLTQFWSYSAFIDVTEQDLRKRLITRWKSYGLSREAAIARAESNDLKNARLVKSKRLQDDLHGSAQNENALQ